MRLENLFFTLLRMGDTAFFSGFVMCLFALPIDLGRRMRKRVIVWMCFIVFFRLLCPVSVSAPFSVFNSPLWAGLQRANNFSLSCVEYTLVGDYDAAIQGTAVYDEALAAGLEPLADAPAILYTRDADGSIRAAHTFREVYGETAAVVWLIGVAAFALYGTGSYLWLRRRTATATRVEDNVYETDRVSAPFILGFLHPKIILPLGLDGERRYYVLCHERVHLKHHDHILKAFAYALMCAYWFHFWLWLYFYRMFTQELELACDQEAVAALGEEGRLGYSETLLALSERRHFIGAVPCAFGESAAKSRVKAALKGKPCTRLMDALSLLLLLAAVLITCTDAI